MILINEADLKPGTTFKVSGKPDMVKRILAKQYGKNPDDFEYRQANNDYVYKPKRKYGTTAPTKQTPTQTATSSTTTAPPPSQAPVLVDASSDGGEGNDGFFKVTTEWMEEHYNKFNDELFDGKLGRCDFIANGSGGNKFGWFTITGSGIKIDRRTRRLYKYNGWDKVVIDRNNFYDLCRPAIGMNTNYSGKAFALENTLIHEMCHYYTYMYGWAPKQGHGPEFRDIANYVSNKGNLDYRIARFGDGDRNEKGYKLDDKIQQQKERRTAKRISNAIIVLTQMNDGHVRLTRAANMSLVYDIIKTHKYDNRAIKTYVYDDSDVINHFADMGYVKTQRTYRCWTLNGSFDDVISDMPDAEPIEKVNYQDMNNENYNRDIVDVITERAVTNIKKQYGIEDSIDVTPGMDLSEFSPLELC